jgi:hypothetical protein
MTNNNMKQPRLRHGSHAATRNRTVTALVARGVSLQGAKEFLAGDVVTGPGDRQRLPRVIGELTAGSSTTAIALLLPAVQQAREAARRPRAAQADSRRWRSAILPYLERAGISPTGRQQFVEGLPVNDEGDRALLAQAVMAGGNVGWLNQTYANKPVSKTAGP